MKVLTVANRKGGAGKSTCAAHMACEAVREGYKVILIDMDPQKTLEGWWNKRTSENPQLVDVLAKDLAALVDKLSKSDFDLCLIDTPGDVSENATAGIEVADLVLVPSKPTSPDLTAIGRTLSSLDKQKKDYVFCITQGISRAKANLQAASVLSHHGPVAPEVISNRVSYANAMGQGSSAVDYDKGASEEVRSVWEFIKPRLFEIKKEERSKLIA